MINSYILYFGCVVFFVLLGLLIFRIINFVVIVFGDKKKSSLGYCWWPFEWLLIRYHPWSVFGFGFTRDLRDKRLIYTLKAGCMIFKVRYSWR